MFFLFYEFEFFQPIDFLDLANESYLKVYSFDSTPSAVKRTVMSRIYYATFLFVREWLIRKGYSSTKNDHTLIPEYISRNGPFSHAENQNISSELRRLKKLRHQADYYINRNDCSRYGEYWINDDIDSAFEAARHIFQKFKRIK